MRKTRADQPPEDSQPLPKARLEFVAEGNLEIVMTNSCPLFILDDAHLSELVSHHFHALRDQFGRRVIGRVQIVISPLSE